MWESRCWAEFQVQVEAVHLKHTRDGLYPFIMSKRLILYTSQDLDPYIAEAASLGKKCRLFRRMCAPSSD